MNTMIFVSARKSLYLIAVAAIGMSAFQLAVAQDTAAPTGSSYPSVSAYPSESPYPSESSYPSAAPTEVSYPSMSPVASVTLSPSSTPVAVTFPPTSRSGATVSVSVNVCPEDCSSLDALAQSPAFLALMAECFIPFSIFFARFVESSGCSPCLADARARVLQTGGSTLTFEFTSASLTFTDEAAAQAFANNLAGLPDVAEALQPGLTMDPASLSVGAILVQPLTAAPTMAPTKGSKDNKKSKKDKKKKDKKTKKKKDSDDEPTTDAPTKAPKSPKATKKGKKDKADKKDKAAKADKKGKR
mmetsp:Transcript_343/g.831  ORF Transcript_343/g.831 Transcript_343/m.831 type:complete len:301 (+) Transcript_343:89-991(+)